MKSSANRKAQIAISLIFIWNSLSAQLPTVRLAELRHPCGIEKGMIRVELIGDTTDVYYEWSNGKRGLEVALQPPK